MARSSSIINVSIIGDARKLIAATGQADKATGGLIKSAAGVAVTGVAVRKGFDIINDSLAEVDRNRDAIQRLENQLGALSGPLIATAGNFTNIAASSTDMLELEAIFADIATSAGLAEPEIAANAEQMSAVALALAQVHDADPSTILEAIGKAIGGQTRGLKEYGIDLTAASVAQRAMEMTGKDNEKALTAQELAAARQSLILEEMGPLLSQVSLGSADLAQKQDILGAKAEEAGLRIGEAAEGPVTAALDLILWMAEAAPGAAQGWLMLGQAIVGVAGDILTPLARAADAARTLLNLLGQLEVKRAQTGHDPIGDLIFGDRNVSNAQRREDERNGLHSGMGGN